MSSAAMKWAQQQRVEHAGLAHMVSVLAAAADRRGATWRSQASLADDMAVTERCVRRYLRALERLGIVQRAHRSNGRGGRSSDVIRLRLDRPFTVTKDAARAVLQPEQMSGSRQSSNRTITPFQPEQRSGEKESDQQKGVITHKEQAQDYQSAQRAADRKPTLAVVNGGCA